MKRYTAYCIMALCMMLATGLSAFGQAKKPTLMVVPGDTWCTENGYMETITNQGKTTRVPDYERAVQENADLVNVITKIGEMMSERGFELKDLGTTIRSISRNQAEAEMTVSRASGSTLAETPLERLLNRAKADIVLEITWQINQMGPKRSVTYNLRALDGYSNKQVAASTGTGMPSFSAELPVMLYEAVLDNMDPFAAQLQRHFETMAEIGREIVVSLRVFDNGSGLSFEQEYGGEELTDIIDNWMSDNTVGHRYSLSDATENMLFFEQVRIPLFRENGNAMDARAFGNQLRKFLQKSPYNIPVKIITKGLGRAELILGEK